MSMSVMMGVGRKVGGGGGGGEWGTCLFETRAVAENVQYLQELCASD